MSIKKKIPNKPTYPKDKLVLLYFVKYFEKINPYPIMDIVKKE